MSRIRTLLASCALLGITGTAPIQGSETYDNPTMDSSPCIVVTDYSVRSATAGNEGYKASATLQNICERSVDLSLCFVYVKPVEETDRACFGGLVRPGALTQVRDVSVPVLLAPPEYRWRYIP